MEELSDVQHANRILAKFGFISSAACQEMTNNDYKKCIDNKYDLIIIGKSSQFEHIRQTDFAGGDHPDYSIYNIFYKLITE